MLGIDDAIANVSKLVDDAVTRIWPDATEVEKAKLAQVSQQLNNDFNLQFAQLKINEVEAASPHWAVAAARPAVIWICALGLFYTCLLQPLLAWASLIWKIPVPPVPDSYVLSTVLGSLLGVSGLRSFDKAKGVATKRFSSK